MMSQVISIWILENESTRIILKGQPKPDVFWIELYQNKRLIERSNNIHNWKVELPNLMGKYDWTKFETVHVNSLFTTLVSDFRIASGNYHKPNSRERILELFARFTNGNEINIKRVGYEFGVGEAEIKKDIKIIRDFLGRDIKTILYSRSNKTYQLKE
jgi:hypothetical protein